MKDYPINMFQIETTMGYEWVVEYPDLKGCTGCGETPELALQEAIENKVVYLEALITLGKEMPRPSEKKETTASGKISLRLSKTMHERLVGFSESEGISINQFIVESVSERIGMMKTADYIENAVSRIEKTLRLRLEPNNILMNKTKPLTKYGGANFGNYKC